MTKNIFKNDAINTVDSKIMKGDKTMLNLQHLASVKNMPPLFERGAPMWNDPYISKQMLDFHLNESHDIASRNPKLINSIVEWITTKCKLQSGMHLLDLGCGPGLYTGRFVDKNIQVTGIDYSQNSIDYAKSHDTRSTYICQNYLDMEFADNTFDLVMMIYGDFCVLSNEERDNLLAKIHQILKVDGYFVFDVTQPQHHQYLENYSHWSILPDGGFWMSEPYLVLEHGIMYTDNISLQEYIVIQSDGTQTIFRNWYHDYTPTTLFPIMEAQQFKIIDFYSDLRGTPYSEESDWCGVIAQKTN